MRVPLSQVQSTFPSIGAVQQVTVTKRNGLGQIGGRVEELEVVGKQGSVSLTGNQFAADFDLYSDWFAVAGCPARTGAGVASRHHNLDGADASTGRASSTSTTTAATSGTSGGSATGSRRPAPSRGAPGPVRRPARSGDRQWVLGGQF